MKNEIATPSGLAMTTCDVKIFNTFVLICESPGLTIQTLSSVMVTSGLLISVLGIGLIFFTAVIDHLFEDFIF